jgi:Protein of unknown function (DUF2569)
MRTDSGIPPVVSGWLLLFCLSLTIAYPGTILYRIFSHTIPRLTHAHTAALVFLLTTYSLLFGAMSIFSFLVGLRLWLVSPGAVRFARHYLRISIGANMAYFVFWILLFRPSQSLSLAQMGWSHVAGPLLYFALWYSYLEHSKRVRATYPQG